MYITINHSSNPGSADPLSNEPSSCWNNIQWRWGRRGARAPGGTFQRGGISRKITNFRPVYGHIMLYGSRLSTSVHQTCSVTFKMHGIHLGPGFLPRHAAELPTLASGLGPRASRGGRMNVCPGGHRPLHRHCGIMLLELGSAEP